MCFTLRVPRTIADLFWLSIQGTITVWTFRAVGWLRFRELCPSGDLWGEARKRPAVHFTLPFLRYPEYVRRVRTLSKRYTHGVHHLRHLSGGFGECDRDHRWFHSPMFDDVEKFGRLTAGFGGSYKAVYHLSREDTLHQPRLVSQCDYYDCLAESCVLGPPMLASLTNDYRERHTALEVGSGAPGSQPSTHSDTKNIHLTWYEGEPRSQKPGLMPEHSDVIRGDFFSGESGSGR